MTELTNYERETIILFNDDEQNATIETANRAYKYIKQNKTVKRWNDPAQR